MQELHIKEAHSHSMGSAIMHSHVQEMIKFTR